MCCGLLRHLTGSKEISPCQSPPRMNHFSLMIHSWRLRSGYERRVFFWEPVVSRPLSFLILWFFVLEAFWSQTLPRTTKYEKDPRVRRPHPRIRNFPIFGIFYSIMWWVPPFLSAHHIIGEDTK